MYFSINDEKHQFVQVDVQDKFGKTPLHWALVWLNRRAVELLLRRGAAPNLANTDGETYLHEICKTKIYAGIMDLFFKLIDENQQTVPIDAQDHFGNTPLHLALKHCNDTAVESLLRRGVIRIRPIGMDRLLCMHIICRTKWYSDNVALVKSILRISDEMGQSMLINARDKLGRTPLQWAVMHACPNMVNLFLDQGADLSSFVFPTTSDFEEACTGLHIERFNFKLIKVSGILCIVENLEKRGYELDRSDAISLMKVLALYAPHSNAYVLLRVHLYALICIIHAYVRIHTRGCSARPTLTALRSLLLYTHIYIRTLYPNDVPLPLQYVLHASCGNRLRQTKCCVYDDYDDDDEDDDVNDGRLVTYTHSIHTVSTGTLTFCFRFDDRFLYARCYIQDKHRCAELYSDWQEVFNTFNFVFRFQWTLIRQTKCKGSWRKLKTKKVFQFGIKELYLTEVNFQSHVQWCITQPVLNVDLHRLLHVVADLKEYLYKVGVAFLRANDMQRCRFICIGPVRIGAVSQQQLGYLDMVVIHGQVQRRIPRFCPDAIGILPELEIFQNGVDAASHAGHVKVRKTRLVSVIHVQAAKYLKKPTAGKVRKCLYKEMEIDASKSRNNFGVPTRNAFYVASHVVQRCGATQQWLAVFVNFGLVSVAGLDHEVDDRNFSD
ncbi:unnamed protein product [Trichogramma brassicae]|uniref:Uncharacterized protein n=1 Tax=Trichogramma brassicae TaxID=86971 RepID=A0A6H5HXT7_9HYME|nr:unnamed protein product [Trichogramma brassicae]